MLVGNMKSVIIFVVAVGVFSNAEQPTFKNVKFKAYSLFTLKFERNIIASETLKDELPKGIYDHIEFTEQNIPILKENSVKDLEDLDELTIQKCGVREIVPGAFRNLPQLRKLSLADNEIQYVPEGVFNNLEISILILSRNQIKEIAAEALNNMPMLLTINLADNFIQSWNPRWFHQVPLLSRVSVQNNSLTKLPSRAFTNLKGPKKYGSVNLTINLIFSHNKISEIADAAFAGLDNINHLWLDNNQLLSLPANLLKDVTVSDLRIGDNQITCFDEGFVELLEKQTSVHLDGNPLDCDCVEKITKWTKQHNGNVDMFISEMNCASARLRKKLDDLARRLKEIKGKDVEEVTQGNMRSENTDDVEVLF